MNKGHWNVYSGPPNVIMGLWNVIVGPSNVNRGQCTVIMDRGM